MKYEHKTVGLNWFDATNLQVGYGGSRSPRNLGAELYYEPDPDNDGWHVVGVIPTSNPAGSSDSSKTFFLLEREILEDRGPVR